MKEIGEMMFVDLFGYRAGRGEKKKLQIIQAVIDILSNEGITYLTFDAVGKRIKTGKATVRYHFKTLEDLIEGAAKLIAFSAQSLTAVKIERVKSPTKARLVDAVIDAAFEWLRENPKHASVWCLFCYYSTFYPRFSALHASIRGKGQERLEKILGTGSETASQIQSLITGTLIDLAVKNQIKDSHSAQRKLRAAVRKIVS
jgi:AcrR family transcriptional regulator